MSLALSATVFLAAIAIDFAYALYVRAAARGAIWRASIYSVLVHGVGSLSLYVAVTQGWLYLIPEAFGLFLGTFLALRYDKLRIS